MNNINLSCSQKLELWLSGIKHLYREFNNSNWIKSNWVVFYTSVAICRILVRIFCDQQNSSYAIKPKTLVSAKVLTQLSNGKLNQMETKLCHLVCAVANCDVNDDCDVMLLV